MSVLLIVKNNNLKLAFNIQYYRPIPLGGEHMGFGGGCKPGGCRSDDTLIIIAIILLLIVLADNSGFRLFGTE